MTCPKCGSENTKHRGYGVQHIIDTATGDVRHEVLGDHVCLDCDSGFHTPTIWPAKVEAAFEPAPVPEAMPELEPAPEPEGNA